VAETVMAVHPLSDHGGTDWTVTELAAGSVLVSGTELPGRDGALRVSAGVALVLGQQISTSGLDPLALLGAARSVVGVVEVAGEDRSPSVLVGGPLAVPASGLNLALTGLVIDVDGVQLATAAGAAAAGHPCNAAVAGLSCTSMTLSAGTVVYTGRWTELIEVRAGSHLQATFGHLGGITVGVV
jgi:2-keto-4-pentenoate hydratase